MARFFFLFMAVSTMVVFVSGCGVALTEATGKVTYKGQPLKHGSITFMPEKGQPATGKIVNGEIVDVTTHQLGDGVVPGIHKVTISAMENPEDMYNTKSLIPIEYSSIRDTPLTAEIKPGKNELVFDLKENVPKKSN